MAAPRLPLFDAESGGRQRSFLDRLQFLVQLDVLGCSTMTSVCPFGRRKRVRLLAARNGQFRFHPGRTRSCCPLPGDKARTWPLSSTSLQPAPPHITATRLTSFPALSSWMISFRSKATMRPSGSRRAAAIPPDHGSQHLFAATVHLEEHVITGDEGVAIGQTLDANGRDSFQFPQHRAAQVPFGDAVRLGHKDVLVGKNLGIRGPCKSGQGPALLAVGAQRGDRIRLGLNQQGVTTQTSARSRPHPLPRRWWRLCRTRPDCSWQSWAQEPQAALRFSRLASPWGKSFGPASPAN